MKKSVIKFLTILTMCLLYMNPMFYVRAEELDTPIDIGIDLPYEYVRSAGCSISISSGSASISSSVRGDDRTTSTSVTVYLEKLVNGSWQPYTSWSHSGGRNQDNTDTTTVSHGAYRVWMSVTATAPGYGSESFNVDGNTVGY